MIDQGANPHIIDDTGKSSYDFFSLWHLNNFTILKSVYFIVEQFSNSIVGYPWRYSNGVFPATFTELIGKGDGGIVLAGESNGVKVAFKFVKIGTLTVGGKVADALADLDTILSEMTTKNATASSCVFKLFGHYR